MIIGRFSWLDPDWYKGSENTASFETETRFSDTTKPVYRSCTLYVLESFGKIMALLFPFDPQTQTHGP